MPIFLNNIPRFLKSKWTLGILFLIIILGGYWFFVRSGRAPYQFITVTRGAIAEIVSVTGNTTPTQSVSLTFGNSGTISNTYSSLGEQV